MKKKRKRGIRVFNFVTKRFEVIYEKPHQNIFQGKRH